MRRARNVRPGRRRWWIAWLLLVAARPSGASPDAFLPVRDPLQDELRILDATDPGPGPGRILLPHLNTLPLQWRELEGAGPPADSTDPARAISLARIERALGRYAMPGFAPHPAYRSTPFTWQASAASQAMDLSLGLEGRGEVDRIESRVVSGSGAQARLAASVGGWLVYTHLLVGQVDQARSFADPLIPSSDVILHTEDTYLAYTGAGGVWGARLGRSRWHWGPGEEGSLTLSSSSPAFTGFAMRARIEPIRADVIALSGTVDPSAGEQLAAHRLEWQPHRRLRIGFTETARYHAPGWQPLYLIGVIPYFVVQRLQAQDNPDSAEAERNNIMIAGDVTWRPVSGTRVYAEILVDDLHSKTSENPDKLGYQAGWEGVGTIGTTRVSWGGEYTRLSRFVYTSFFGRSYEVQGQPLGFPTGPDAGRLSLRGAWDLNLDWQLGAQFGLTDQGEGTLAQPYVPGTPKGNPFDYEGVVERTRDAVATARWWPASGVDLAASAGYRWISNDAHVSGADRETPTAALSVRLTR